MNFREWLYHFRKDDTPLGDLARGMLNDPDLPRITKRSKKQVYHYLKRQNENAALVFCEVWGNWYYLEYYVKRFQERMFVISDGNRELWK